MNCDQFKSDIFSFTEGKLSEELYHGAQEHLKSCVVCTRLLSAFNTLDAIIDLDKATEPNPFAATRIMQHIESDFDRSTSQNTPVWIRALQPAAIAVALLSGILIGSYTAKKESVPVNQMATTSENIAFLKSNLFISEFADEDRILVINK